MRKKLFLLPIMMLMLAACSPKSSSASDSAPASSGASSDPGSSTTSSSSSSGETSKYGTADNPLTVAEALAICDEELQESGDWTAQEVFVRGLIVNTPTNKSSYSQQIKIADTATSTQLLVYSMNHDADKAPYQNDTLTVKGWITLYGSTIEFSNKESDYPTELALARGTSQITYTAIDTGITFGGDKPTSATNATNFSFTVAKEDPSKNLIVKVNNEVVEPTAGVYTGTVKGNTSVSAEYQVVYASVDVAYPACDTTTNMAVDTNEAAKVGLSASAWEIKGIQNDASNNVGLNKAGQIRLYNYYRNESGKTHGNGNALSIKPLSVGVVIKRITIELHASTVATLNDVEVKAGSNVISGTASVYDVGDASVVTIQNKSMSDASAQLWISKVTVFYA